MDEKAILSEQDEEFLECINDLSESEKNCIIFYMKDKIEASREALIEEIIEYIDKTDMTGYVGKVKEGLYKKLGELEAKQ